MADLNFNNCLGTVIKGSRVIEFQFNREYDINNNIWYKINNDFLADEWAQNLEYETIDKMYTGDGRTKQETESFKETLEVTLQENYNQAFYRELYDIMQTDDGLLKLCNGGLNVRVTIYFATNSWVRTTYNCCSPNPAMRIYHQAEGSENTFDMPIVINYSPTLTEYNGFNIPLPEDIQDVSFTTVITENTGIITTNIAGIQDPNHLVLEYPDDLRIIIYDNTGIAEVLYTDVSNIPVSVPSTNTYTAGTYTIELSYLYLINSTGNFYRTTVVKEITI